VSALRALGDADGQLDECAGALSEARLAGRSTAEERMAEEELSLNARIDALTQERDVRARPTNLRTPIRHRPSHAQLRSPAHTQLLSPAHA
jgi:hypothetical protein